VGTKRKAVEDLCTPNKRMKLELSGDFFGFVSGCVSTIYNFFEDTVFRPVRTFARATQPPVVQSSETPFHGDLVLPPSQQLSQPLQREKIQSPALNIHSRLHNTTPLTGSFTSLFTGPDEKITESSWYNGSPTPKPKPPPLFHTRSLSRSPIDVIKPQPYRAIPDSFEFFPLEEMYETHMRREASLKDLRVKSLSLKKKTWEEVEIERRKERLRLEEEERKRKEELRKLEEEKRKKEMEEDGEDGEAIVYSNRFLTDKEEAATRNCFKGHGNDVLVKHFNIEITRNDIRSLGPGQWLNDEIVNFYMELLKESAKNKNKVQCHFFNSFFYTLLSVEGTGYNYGKVSKWTKKIDIFQLDKIIIPVHLGAHWCLACVSIKRKRIEYYDSMGGTNIHCRKCLRQYITDEYKLKYSKELDLSEWTDHAPGSKVPQQQNTYDCGVFMCIFAAHVTQNKSFGFSQNDMPFFRKRIMLDILQKKFSG